METRPQKWADSNCRPKLQLFFVDDVIFIALLGRLVCVPVVCRNGSQLVKETREKKDKDKSRMRFWEMAGSKMAAVTGLTNEEAAAAAEKAAQEVSIIV